MNNVVKYFNVEILDQFPLKREESIYELIFNDFDDPSDAEINLVSTTSSMWEIENEQLYVPKERLIKIFKKLEKSDANYVGLKIEKLWIDDHIIEDIGITFTPVKVSMLSEKESLEYKQKDLEHQRYLEEESFLKKEYHNKLEELKNKYNQ